MKMEEEWTVDTHHVSLSRRTGLLLSAETTSMAVL